MRSLTRPGPDWFTASYAEAAFHEYLRPYAGQTNFLALQIGAYCGDASQWLMDHVLTGPGSWLVDVDTWAGSEEHGHDSINWDAVQEFYVNRMLPYSRHTAYVGTSDSFFDRNHIRDEFNFVYIDGAHTSEQVLRDAVNADRCLKVGGIMAFDDYQWYEQDNTRDVPGPAIDAFLRCYERRYEVIAAGMQVWVRRVR